MGLSENIEMFNEIAGESLKKYGFEYSHQTELLQISENITYLVRNKINHRKEFVLRLSRPGYHTVSELKAELIWIREIQEYTPLIVAQPVPATDGMYVKTVQAENKGESYTCVMFEFLPGKAPDESDKKNALKEFEKLGETTAYLHRQSKMWNSAHELKRFTWDYDTMIGEQARWGKWQDARNMTPKALKLLDRTSQVIKKRLFIYGKDSKKFGLIHADLRLSNLLVEDEQIKIIDFDDCGFGWYMHDMATAVSFIEDKKNTSELLEAWKTGYSRIEHLSKEDVSEKDTFIMLRRLQLLAWLTSHSDSDPAKVLSVDFLEGTINLADKYMRKFG